MKRKKTPKISITIYDDPNKVMDKYNFYIKPFQEFLNTEQIGKMYNSSTLLDNGQCIDFDMIVNFTKDNESSIADKYIELITEN